MALHFPIQQIIDSLPAEALLDPQGLPYPKVASGKVRDIYDTGDAYLIVASDRLSAFDVVLPNGIPGKGILLTQISLHWFEVTQTLIQNHLVPDHTIALADCLKGHEEMISRSMLVRKMKPLPIEAVVRQYLAGSGWNHYMRFGTLFGLPVPEGMLESGKLTAPLFTPTTKAQQGDHDAPMTYDEGVDLLGEACFDKVRDISLKLFALGSAAARNSGLILADTKFEFGLDPEGEIHLIDEILTPDSSRYWPLDSYEPGKPQTAFDKQYVRDFLETLAWDKSPPGPTLPEDVINKTQHKYIAALEKLLPNES